MDAIKWFDEITLADAAGARRSRTCWPNADPDHELIGGPVR
jgi:hypothetical protein